MLNIRKVNIKISLGWQITPCSKPQDVIRVLVRKIQDKWA